MPLGVQSLVPRLRESQWCIDETTSRSILDDVAALARTKDPESEARQLVVPDDVVLLSGFGRLDTVLSTFAFH